MDIISYNKARETKDKIILGESKDLIGIPSDGSYVLAGSIVRRDAYPELDNLYPQTPAPSFNVIANSNSSGSISGRLIAYNSMYNAWNILDKNGGSSKYSTDGITWNSSAGYSTNTWNAMKFFGSYFIAVGAGAALDKNIMYNASGPNWLGVTVPSGVSLYDLAVSPSKCVAIGSHATSGFVVGTSTTGTGWSWFQTNLPAGAFYNITYGNNKFVTIGEFTGNVYWSDDGITWSNTNNSVGNGVWESYTIEFDGTQFIAINFQQQSTIYATSTSGDVWVLRNLPPPGALVAWNQIASNPTSGITVISSYYNYAVSLNGIDWEVHTKNPLYGYPPYGLAYGNEIFIELSNNYQYRIQVNPINPYIDLTGVEGQYVRVK